MIKKTPAPGKIFTQPSLTVPDQTMSIRTIMERYARGLPTDNVKTPLYDVDELSQGVDLRKLDLVDIQEMSMSHKKTIGKHKDDLKKADEKKKRDLLEEEITRRVNNALNSNNNP
jgi:hypothetical protein